jgi:predicted thioesterase
METTSNIPIGASGSHSVVVTPELTVAHFHPTMPAVYATPMMIYLMELAASAAIEEYLPAGWTSVGTHVDVQHIAATPEGFTVTANATVTARTEKTVTFEVEAHDGVERIGIGTHTRAPIERDRFDQRIASKRSGSG